MKAWEFTIKEGEKVAVVRPDNAGIALQLADVARRRQDADLFQKIPSMVGRYTFMGYLGFKGRDVAILDDRKVPIGKVKPGDSCVHPNALVALS